jgi:hypothetical protein
MINLHQFVFERHVHFVSKDFAQARRFNDSYTLIQLVKSHFLLPLTPTYFVLFYSLKKTTGNMLLRVSHLFSNRM